MIGDLYGRPPKYTNFEFARLGTDMEKKLLTRTTPLQSFSVDD